MSINMEGVVLSFRRGRKTYTPKHFLIQPFGCDSREKATKLVGKKVSWKSESGKIINGEIAAAHGGKGVIRAIFEKGLPGQAITTKVTIA